MAEKPIRNHKMEQPESPPKSHHFDPFDPHNPFILSHLSRMAEVHMSQKNFKAGVPLLQAIFEGQKKDPNLGPSNSTTMQSELRYLNAKFYLVYDNGRGDVEEAIKIFEESYQLQNKLRVIATSESPALRLSDEELEALDKVHRARVNGFRCIILVRQGKVGEAYKLYKSVFHTFYQYLGGEHSETLHAFRMAEILARKYDDFDDDEENDDEGPSQSETETVTVQKVNSQPAAVAVAAEVKNGQPSKNLTSTLPNDCGSPPSLDKCKIKEERHDQKFERPLASSSPNSKVDTPSASVKGPSKLTSSQGHVPNSDQSEAATIKQRHEDARTKFLKGCHDDNVTSQSLSPAKKFESSSDQNFDRDQPAASAAAAAVAMPTRKSSHKGAGAGTGAAEQDMVGQGREGKDNKKNKNCVLQ